MRPIRFATVDEARAALDLPADATYVTWRPEWAHLEQAFTALGPNDILVLPERDAPYLVDSTKGFTAGGSNPPARVDGVTRQQTGRGWFSMARARRGIVGLGPNVVIQPSASAFTQGPQPDPVRYWYDTTGKAYAMTGAAEKVIDFAYAGTVTVANFVMRGRDFGGVAYSAFSHSAGVNADRVFFDAAHRGFKGAPNGESGAISCSGTYRIRNVEVECRDASGASVATSPFMFNRSGGGVIEDSWAHHATKGFPTTWECWGSHQWRRFTSEGNWIGANFESNGRDRAGVWQGMTVTMEDCRLLNPVGAIGTHLYVKSPYGSQRITLTRCAVSGGRVPGSLVVTHYSPPTLQLDADITGTDPAGKPLAVTFYR
jgi:hypothetical protein